MSGVLTGDLGTSNFNQKPVSDADHRPDAGDDRDHGADDDLHDRDRHPVRRSCRRCSGTRRSTTWCDRRRCLGLAVPSFWVATLVLVLPSEWWGYAPMIGRKISLVDDPIGNFKQVAPAAAVLALGRRAGIMRLTRSSLLEVMRQDYMRTARAKGLRERSVVIRHGLKNSMIPVVTVLGLQMSRACSAARSSSSRSSRCRAWGCSRCSRSRIKDFDVVADDDAVRGRHGRRDESAGRCQLCVAGSADPLLVRLICV